MAKLDSQATKNSLYYQDVYGNNYHSSRVPKTTEHEELMRGYFSAMLKLEGELPSESIIQITGMDGCYQLEDDGNVRVVECPCSSCKEHGMLNGACRKSAYQSQRKKHDDYLKAAMKDYPEDHHVSYDYDDNWDQRGGDESSSPMDFAPDMRRGKGLQAQIKHVQLPPYHSQSEEGGDEEDDVVFGKYSASHVARAMKLARVGGKKKDDGWDSEAESIDDLPEPSRNRLFN